MGDAVNQGAWAYIFWNDIPEEHLRRYFSFNVVDDGTDDEVFFYCENETEFLEIVRDGSPDFTIVSYDLDPSENAVLVSLRATAKNLGSLCASIVIDINLNELTLEKIEQYANELVEGDYSLLGALQTAQDSFEGVIT